VTVTRALTFSRDGRRLAMGSDLPLDEFGGTPGGVGVHARLGVWDAATGRPRTWSDGPRVGVTAVAFSPGSRRVAYGSADGVTRVWELGARGRGPAMRGHTGQITTVAYSRRGDLIVTGSGDGDARVWTQDGRPVAKLAGNGAWVVGATFSPDGRRLVTADEGAARLWQRPAGSSERLVSGVLATSQDGMRALARRRGALRIVGVDGGRTLATLHGAQAADAAFADGDRRVITAGYEGVTLWNAQTGARIVRRSGYSFAVDYGRGPYGVLTEHGVRRWDLETGRLERPLDRGHYFLPAISDDGRFVAAWSSERVVVWDTRTRKRVAVLRHQVPSAFQFSPDGRTLSITAYFDAGSARLWRPGGGAPLRLATHGRVDRVRFSPDGSLVATLGVESAVRIWDTSDGHRVAVLQGHRAAVRDAAFSRDGKRIATVSLDGTARLWNARDGSLVEQIWTRDSPVRVSLAGGDHRILLSGYSSLESYSCTLCGNLGELVQLAQQRAP
jgi:WD40 repeat protein